MNKKLEAILRAEIDALKKEIESIDVGEEIREAESRGREAQRAEAQIEADRAAVVAFCRVVDHWPANAVLAADMTFPDPVTGYARFERVQIDAGYFHGISGCIARLGIK